MPIKKSSLEQKWYYRVAKVFFLILPLVFIILLLLGRKTIVCDVSPTSAADMLQKNIIYVAVGLVFYFLILTTIWRGFLYIAFGGLEDDTRNNNSAAVPAADPAAQPVSAGPDHRKMSQIIPIIIALGIMAILLLSSIGYIKLPKIKLNSVENASEKTAPIVGNCPTKFNPPCNSVQGGVAMRGGPIPASCERCPDGSHYSGTMDNTAPGGPYKICVCD